jgi:tRNA pseudouridine55 synthase
MNGVLNLHKPSGWTSHDVVAKVRGILKEKQIGHLGTLDPMATGVLPLAVGLATRLIEFTDFSKEYSAVCLLGKDTDSGDITGKVLAEKDASTISVEQIRTETLRFRDLTEQIPPMVSALKQGGRKLYELAREGKTVERKPRPVKILEVEVLEVKVPRVSFRVVCSAGTYVRVLCQTLGEKLGVGGCMESLQRTKVGPFSLADSFSMEEVQNRMEKSDLSGMLLPAGLLAGLLPALTPGEKELAFLCQGRPVDWVGTPGKARILNLQGRLCAIGEVSEDGKVLKAHKVFGLEGLQ